MLAVTALLVVGSAVLPPSSAGDGGSQYFLSNTLTNGGLADVSEVYGRADDAVLVGDWDGDGADSLGVRRGAQILLANGTAGGAADVTFAYGRVGDQPLVGDWDGDGVDTLGVRRGNEFYLRNSLTGGAADVTFAYGKAGDEVVVGDWDGDGRDTVGVRRGNVYYLTDRLAGGVADTTLSFGRSTDQVLVGSWVIAGPDRLAVRRGDHVFYDRTGIVGGAPVGDVVYGHPADTVLAGDWDGDGKDTLAVRRPVRQLQTSFAEGGSRVGVEVMPGRYHAAVPAESAGCSVTTSSVAGSAGTGHETAFAGESIYVDAVLADDLVGSEGCGTWRRVDPRQAPVPTSNPDGGFYRIGSDLLPGWYRTFVPDGLGCYVAQMGDFHGDDFGNGAPGWYAAGSQVDVAVTVGEVGFYSHGCGEWHRIGS
ncbi:MAG TPA: hypothetical protein VGC04_06740 [Cellulomonas sp.]